MPDRPINPADVWPALMGNAADGALVRQSLALLLLVPPEAFTEAIGRIQRETTLGPMRDPTAFLDGRLFANARYYTDLLTAAAKLRAEIERAIQGAAGWAAPKAPEGSMPRA